ncbi:MAG: P1 family peptidase [Deltaproteobacteria bacterium]|nr:MAG: P1 family peptidase [Deltaproteobacteria bacterium]
MKGSVPLESFGGIEGIRLGQVTDTRHRTGCTVVLAEEGAVAGVDVRGGAPGTHGTDALRPENLVDRLHAVVLTGGSAFGLATVQGVMQYLRERNIGFKTDHGVVPIVSGAVVFDLGLNHGGTLPNATTGYQACERASVNRIEQGCVGAGTGATVGKLFGLDRAMKGGQGFAFFESPEGLQILALAVVNAYGDVRDPDTGELLAGVRTPDGRRLADAAACLPTLVALKGFSSPNTVLGVVATNASFSKAELTRVAQMAQDGIARAVVPAHTLYDGDTIFALATGAYGAVEVTVLGALAAQLMAQAIVNGIHYAEGVDGVPAHRDLFGN